MYRFFIKPFLFWLNVERAKDLVVAVLKFISSSSILNALLKRLYRVEDVSLEREVFGMHFSNPVGMAAGFDNNGEIIKPLSSIGFSFVEIGSVTPEPEMGNPKPRIYRLPKDKSIIQRMGHPNKGWMSAIENLRRERKGVIVGCNIARNNNTFEKTAQKELLRTFRNLYQYSDYFTVNINYDHLILSDESLDAQSSIATLLEPLFEFRRGQSDYRPILLKVSPDLEFDMIDAISDVLIDTPLDGIVAVSGSKLRHGLKTSQTSLSRVGAGRLSGEPLKERALEIVSRIYERTGGAYPIIGVGGISTAEDAQKMLDAGASLIQIYSSFIYEGPRVVGDICRGLINRENTQGIK